MSSKNGSCINDFTILVVRKSQPTGRSLYLTSNLLKRLGGIVEPASFCRLFRPKSKEVGLFAAMHLTHIYDEGKTWEYQNQSTGISNFQTTIFLENEFVVIPSIEILEKFYFKVHPLILKATNNQNMKLTKLRDTLLPKLVSGEVRVPEVFEILANRVDIVWFSLDT